jgi:hypothetical protein
MRTPERLADILINPIANEVKLDEERRQFHIGRAVGFIQADRDDRPSGPSLDGWVNANYGDYQTDTNFDWIYVREGGIEFYYKKAVLK